MKDEIYKSKQNGIENFEFNENVTKVFPDMIRRSIPGYETIIAVSGLIAWNKIIKGTNCYDLGCSRGATTSSIVQTIGNRPCTIHAVDNSSSMVSIAQKEITDPRVRLRNSDINDISITNASAVFLNFTLQFIDPAIREQLLRKIYLGCRPGAILVLSEKVITGAEYENLHLQFKKQNGYSQLEISQKRDALENVMRIDEVETLETNLTKAGFTNIRIWFRCLNWVSILADK